MALFYYSLLKIVLLASFIKHVKNKTKLHALLLVMEIAKIANFLLDLVYIVIEYIEIEKQIEILEAIDLT